MVSQPLCRASIGACDQGGCAKFLAIVTKRSCRRFSGIKKRCFDKIIGCGEFAA
nr:MAG TPA: hypothetical protein [Caudoviricetes sp.]